MTSESKAVVAVVGGGTMGAGIAQSFAQAAYSVLLIDASAEALGRARKQITANLRQFKETGLISSIEEPLARIEFLPGSEVLGSTPQLKLVVESIPEDLQLKRRLFSDLDSLPDEVILASNTSSFTLSAITEGMDSAHRTVGLHYFNPAHIIPAVEIHRGAATSEQTVATAQALVESTGKACILVRKEVAGFVINRLTGALEREVDFLLDNGVVSPEDLDKAVKASLGFRLACLGPMEAEDLIGLDVAARVSGNIFKQLSNATEPSPDLVEKVSRGELGIKSGRGWYDYTGSTREEVLARHNARLLRQLALFQENSGSGQEEEEGGAP